MTIVVKKTAVDVDIGVTKTEIFENGAFGLSGARAWCFVFANEGDYPVTIEVFKRAGPGAGTQQVSGLTQVVPAHEPMFLEFDGECCEAIHFTGRSVGGVSEGCFADFVGRL